MSTGSAMNTLVYVLVIVVIIVVVILLLKFLFGAFALAYYGQEAFQLEPLQKVIEPVRQLHLI